MFMYLAPLSILIVITFKLRSALKKMSEQQICCKYAAQNQSQRNERDRRITFSLFMILTVFIICQSTTCLAYLQFIIFFFVIETHIFYVQKMIFISFVARHVLIVFNSSINVLVYVYFSKHYRNLVRKHVLKHFQCNKS